MSDEPAPKTMIHIDAAEKRPDLPDTGEAKSCGRVDCPAPRFEMGFGLAGGGYGVYEYCEVCGEIVSKTEVHDE